jgi:hypothetical protein
LTLVLINVIGYWRIEDLFTSGPSLGSRFGLSNDVNRTEELIYSRWGVPLLDFGIIGGYRLPFQGSINTGPFWIFRELLPVEILLPLTQLSSMIVAALAFGWFWQIATSVTSTSGKISDLFYVLCWVSLQVPVLNYTLQEDWYSAAITNQAFVGVLFSLVAAKIQIANTEAARYGINRSIWLFLSSCYFLTLGHSGLLAVYGPTVLLLLVVVVAQLWKSRSALDLAWARSRPQVAFLIIVIARASSMMIETLIEASRRSEIGSRYFWANPTRSYSDFKAFVKQFVVAELEPLLTFLNPDWVTNAKSVSTLYPGAIIILACFTHLIQRRLNTNIGTIKLLLALWLLSLLMLMGILPTIFRIPQDWLYRDVLLALALAVVGVVFGSRAKREAPSSRLSVNTGLLLTLSLFSAFFSVDDLVSQLRNFGISRYSLPHSLRQSDDWIQGLGIQEDDIGKTLAVLDPRFLNQWGTFDGEGDSSEWKGLRGFFQIRQAGMKTLEGTPKIRDATAFTGDTRALKQSINPPNAAFCDPVLLGLLNVSKVIVSDANKSQCLRQLTIRGSAFRDSWYLTTPKRLAGSQVWIADFSSDFAVSVDSEKPLGGLRCGLLKDPNCGLRLGLTISESWETSSRECRLPCVLRLTRTEVQQADDATLVVPFNYRNSLFVVDQDGQHVPLASVNGLIAIPIRGDSPVELMIVVQPDSRMWLQILVAYAQYLALAYVAFDLFFRAKFQRRLCHDGKNGNIPL